jgi:hypothetical protein
MRYTVTWDESAQDELARLWVQASDRKAVERASNEIDHALRFRPLGVGSEDGEDRRLTLLPLQVLYNVSPDDCRARVLFVWSI